MNYFFSQRNQENLPVGDYLYKKSAEIENNKKVILEKSFTDLEEKQRSIYNPFSLKLFAKKKSRKIREIFDHLDSDKDGIISASNINITTISNQILQYFTPLLQELEELNQELNFEEFSDATERLLKTLSVNERAEILGFNERKASENLSFSFQVFIWIFGKSLLNLLAGNQ